MKRIGRVMRFREAFHGSLCGKRCWAVVLPWPTRQEAIEHALEIGGCYEVVKITPETDNNGEDHS